MNGIRSIWGLRLLAIVVAIFLWFIISAPEREGVSEKALDVTVSYSVPAGLIVLDPVEKLSVRFRGPTSRIVALSPADVGAFVDLSDAQPGPASIQLRPDRDFQVPDQIEITSVRPNALQLNLDREVARHVEVEPVFAGEPPAGQVLERIVIAPPTVLARGPASRLTADSRLQTAPIRLDESGSNFTSDVAVIPSDPLIQVLEPQMVNVRIALEPEAGDEGETPNADTAEPAGGVGERARPTR